MMMLGDVAITRLDNGATVVTVPDERAQGVAVAIAIQAGGRHENREQTGISHFLEHMLFKGTTRRSAADISRAIEGRGGVLNAYTSESSTFYYANLPYEYASVAFDVLCDMYLNATIEPLAFERERSVILEEIKMYEDWPQEVASEKLRSAVYPGHALGRALAGTTASLARMTPQALQAYKQQKYVPATTYFAFAGRVEHRKCVAMVEQALRQQARGRKAGYQRWHPGVGQERLVVTHKEVFQTHANLGFRTFGHNDPRRHTLQLLDVLLGKNMSSRLFQSVREKNGLCYDIGSSVQAFEETGVFVVHGGFDTDKVASALKLIGRELRLLQRTPVGTRELQRAREFLSGGFRLGLESSFVRLAYVVNGLMRTGRVTPPSEHLGKFKLVTPTDILQLAHELFNAESMSLSLVGPASLTNEADYWCDILQL